MTPSERVRRLIASGAVAPDEGERLLAAMHDAPRPSRLAMLVNPFDRFGGEAAAALGALVSVASIAVARLFGVRFDGLLDLHFNAAAPPTLRVAMIDQLAGWLVPALCFWAYARAWSKHVRLVDFVGMAGLARLPLLVGALVMFPLVPPTLPDPPQPTPALLAVALLAMIFVVANVTWLYQGFKNASGLAGKKLVVGFIGLVLGVEALSKLVIFVLAGR